MPNNNPPHDHSNYHKTTRVPDPGLFGNGDDMDVEVPTEVTPRISRKRSRDEPEDEDIRIQKEAKADWKELENYLASIGALSRDELLEECRFLYEVNQDLRKKADEDWVYESQPVDSYEWEY